MKKAMEMLTIVIVVVVVLVIVVALIYMVSRGMGFFGDFGTTTIGIAGKNITG